MWWLSHNLKRVRFEKNTQEQGLTNTPCDWVGCVYCAALGWPFWFNWNYICPGCLQDLWIDDSIPLTGWGTGRLAKSQVEVNISLQKSVHWHSECRICRKHPVCVFWAVDLHTQGNLRHWGCFRSTEQAQIFRITCLLCSWSLDMWQNQECQKSSNCYSQTGCWIARNPRQAVAYLYFPLKIPPFQQIYKVF